MSDDETFARILRAREHVRSAVRKLEDVRSGIAGEVRRVLEGVKDVLDAELIEARET